MSRNVWAVALIATIAFGWVGVAPSHAAPTTEIDALRAELSALRSELNQMRQSQNEGWLNERRAEEVKGLIREVLEDADTRATLMDDAALAGIDENGKIFLRSADNKYYVNIYGHIQLRYIWNHEDGRGSDDGESEEGLQVRRAKVGIKGHIGDPRIKYSMRWGQSRKDSSDQDLDEVKLSYKHSDQAVLSGGFYKVPLLRQELNSSSKQIAVDRASITEAFTLNKAKQVSLGGTTDAVKYDVAYLTTVDDDYTDFGDDTGSGDEDIHFGLAGRATVMLVGDDWKAFSDYNAWSGQDPAVFLGGAVAYLNLDNQAGTGVYPAGADTYTVYTVDASYQGNALTLNAAYMGNQLDAATDVEQCGILAEAAYFLNKKVQPFVRYEWGDDDMPGTDDLEIVTVGVNYYLAKHNSKFTIDVACKLNGDFTEVDTNGTSNLSATADSAGIGFDESFSDDDDQIAVRAQYQLKF